MTTPIPQNDCPHAVLVSMSTVSISLSPYLYVCMCVRVIRHSFILEFAELGSDTFFIFFFLNGIARKLA